MITQRGRKTGAPHVVLHIGRNKAGSTTIQDFCLASYEALYRLNIRYSLFGHLKDSQPGLAGFQTFDELAAFASAHRDQIHLISNEFMFGWPDEFTRAAAAALATCSVEVLAYIRPYDAWALSAYAEETRRGLNFKNIDDYLAEIDPGISAWPHLNSWGEHFGWDRLRVRSLDPSGLDGGDLLTDFACAIGAYGDFISYPPSNTAPHWLELELLRALAMDHAEEDWTGGKDSTAVLLATKMRSVAREVPPVSYLTRSQREAFLDLYNDDLLLIEAAGGPILPVARTPEEQERSFVPSLRSAPPHILKAFFDATTGKEFVLEFPIAALRARQLADQLNHGAGR